MSPERIRRHFLLALLALFAVAVLFVLFGSVDERWAGTGELKAAGFKWRMSMSLAYGALGFLAATLLIGPVHVLRHPTRPANNMLRRDVGIWTGVLALSHVSVAMLVHVKGLKIWTLFVSGRPGPGNWLPLQFNLFGLANFAGLAQATVLVLLLVISNNIFLRRLGVRRWKSLQRLTYAALLLIVIHALSYQSVEFRARPIRLLFLTLVSTIALIQALGAFTVVRRSRRRSKTRTG